MGGIGSGRPPKPAQIKRLEGNRSKVARAKLDKNPPQGKGKPRVPLHLTAAERKLWAHIVDALPAALLCRADEPTLERMAVYWSRFREAGRMLARSSLLVQSPQGSIRNPLLAIQNDAAREMHRASGELGLSPVARARLTAAGSESDDPMELLLGMESDDDGWLTPGCRR